MLLKDDWLEQYLGKAAYCFKPPFDEDQLPEGFIFAKTSAEDASSINVLINKGFKQVETLVQFEQQRVVERRSIGFSVRASKPEDENEVTAIAADAFVSSRLYQDPMIPNEVASKIKEEWVRNFYHGKRGDAMIVAEDEGRIMGFVLLIGDVIDLIAVSKQDYKKGVASAMIAFINEEHGTFLKAGTQAINEASIALYQKCGFVKVKETDVFHYHTK